MGVGTLLDSDCRERGPSSTPRQALLADQASSPATADKVLDFLIAPSPIQLVKSLVPEPLLYDKLRLI